MTTKELVLDFLRQQGFCPDVDPDNGNIFFKYQMKNFIFVDNSNDNEFFQLILPGIFDVTEDNRYMVLEAINQVNVDVKVAKATIFGEESVWVFYENMLDSTPNIEDILPRALQILVYAQDKFYQALK